MVKITNHGIFYRHGEISDVRGMSKEEARRNTMSYSILNAHNVSKNPDYLNIKFDAMASHDITYVGIIQTAKASGLKEFPIPYVLTNCHNSLCAVGGTINEDDHLFGLSAAKKYGGIYVPAHQAVIHSFMRENFAGCGKMILGSDSHTRYGAIGCMAIGEGGPELVKQLLKRTYDIKYPEIICVHLTGAPKKGVGPQDVALALIGAVFKSGFVKNKVLEFVGEGIASLPMEFRNGIDVMTTETTCLSSIWETDKKTEEYLTRHGRKGDYYKLAPHGTAYYDGLVEIDLSTIEPMIALPFHPSNTYTIREFLANAPEILAETEKTAVEQLGIPEGRLDLQSKFYDGKMHIDQGVIAGCAGGTFDNLTAAADILRGKSTGNGAFSLSVYPASQPVLLELMKTGVAQTLVESGATLRTAFCGPCFGAGDVPACGGLSIRHSTRNFPNREGSKPSDNQIAAVALMDSRSIAATAANGGILTPADEFEGEFTVCDYNFDSGVYDNRVYNGFGNPKPEVELVLGPNITDWPEMPALADNVLIKAVSIINDPVTTTDELIPSGDTSSYRSNPIRLAQFTLSRKDPEYVSEAKKALEAPAQCILDRVSEILGKNTTASELQIGSTVCALRPGDGSAREQAASCQRVLGGTANIALEYATKRYRSNLINWGMLPFTYKGDLKIEKGDYVLVPNVREAVISGAEKVEAYVINTEKTEKIELLLENLSAGEREILSDGCLINHYAK
ncbi:MAG: hydratase [Ruminococcaceae bacterium]|nr:hydratase [Oscillospiraceae bacterium]